MKHQHETPLGEGFFRKVIITGVAALLLAIGGTSWFGLYQSSRLHEIAETEAYFMRLIECRSKISAIERQFSDERNRSGSLDELQSKLRVECSRFSEIGSSTGIRPGTALTTWLKDGNPESGTVSEEQLQLMLVDLDRMIDATTNKIADDNNMLVTSLHLYLILIALLLLLVVVAGGRLLISMYRHSLIPLHQLAQRLTMLNSNLPESVHDTAEAAKTMLSDPEPSAEIRSVSASVADLCHEIEEKNKKLDEIYIRDEKTNLYNYRHFKEHLIIDVERAKRFGAEIALAMIDIDYFKRYNDHSGHIAGDKVLLRIAEIIKEECRATDIPSKFGGDEFALLFPKTDRYTALEISERLRTIISAEPFEHEQKQPGGQLTVSIGVAAWPDDASDWSSLISNADKALYEAKTAGRNRVTSYVRPLVVTENE